MGLGCQLLGCECLPSGRSTILRLYIDNSEGVSIADCQRISTQVSAVLEVEQLINGQYRLEVSSPGLDRPLFTCEQLEQQQGNKVKIQLIIALNGRKKFVGVLSQVRDGIVELIVDGEKTVFPYDNVAKAHVVPDL